MPAAERNNGSALLVGVGVLGAAWLLYKKVLRPDVITPLKTKHYIMQLRFNLVAVRFKGDNVEFDVYIQNPNSQPMRIGAIVGDAYVVDQSGKSMKLGNVARYTQTVLKPQAETKFTFSVRLRALQLVAYFTRIIQGQISHQAVTFVGSININGRLYPVRESYQIA